MLKRFVEMCDRMRGSRLMEVARATVTVPAQPTTAGEIATHLPELAEVDEIYQAHPDIDVELNVREDDIGAFLMPFRQLYQQSDETEVGKVRNMLSKHAHEQGTPEGAQTVEDLKSWKADYRGSLRESPMGTMIEFDSRSNKRVEYTPENIIENWLNGDFFHAEPEAARKLEGRDRGLHAFVLIGAVEHVAGYMLELGDLARAILNEPALQAN